MGPMGRSPIKLLSGGVEGIQVLGGFRRLSRRQRVRT